MRILQRIVEKYSDRQPLKGKNILLCTHATSSTENLVGSIIKLGGKVFYWPIDYSRNDSSVKSIKKIGASLLGNEKSISKFLPKVDIIMEDGMRVSRLVHKFKTKLRKGVYSIEQTTSGIRHFEDHMNSGGLMFPVINVAESKLKLGIENSMSTPETVLSSLFLETGSSLIHKNVLVMGFGPIGSGVAKLCRSHGGHVTVAEIDSVKCTIAASLGFPVVTAHGLNQALPRQDIVISCTSNRHGFGLGVEQFLLMKDGATVLNAGSGRGEIAPELLWPGSFTSNRAKIKVSKKGDNLYCIFGKMGMSKTVRILASAHPINLRSGKGNPEEILDFVFSSMLLAAINASDKLPLRIHPLSKEIEHEVVTLWERFDRRQVVPHLVHESDFDSQPRPWGKLFRMVSPDGNLDNFSVVRAIFAPGSQTQGHFHLNSEEAYIVESGVADIMVWNPKKPEKKTKHHVKSGDYLAIPRGYAHKVLVPSSKEFICLVIASPPFSFWDQFFPEK